MTEDTGDNSAKNITFLFTLFIILQPLLYFIILLISLGLSSTGILKPLVIFYPLIAFFTVIFFISKNRYLDKIIDFLQSGKEFDQEELAVPVKKYPFESMIILFSGCMAAPFIAVLSGLKSGIIISAQQGIFFFMMGAVLACIAGAVFFLRIKIILFRYMVMVGVKPLALWQKLSIPLLAAFLGMIILVFSAIYRVYDQQSFEMVNSRISSSVKLINAVTDRFFTDVANELEAYARTESVQNMDYQKLMPFLVRLGKEGNLKNIEMYFTGNLTGKGIHSFGGTGDISERDYFKTLIKEKRVVFSEPLLSQISKKDAMVCAVPVLRENQLVGAFGVTLLVEKINSLLASEKITRTGRFMIISKEGKFLFHAANRDLLGKVIGKDIIDDGSSIVDSGLLVTAPPDRFFSYTFYGNRTISYKTVIPSLGHFLVFSLDRKDYMKSLNYLIMAMIAGMFFSTALIFAVILFMARRFSNPIHNTIDVFRGLADGDLTVTGGEYMEDEFGELLRNMKLFQRKLRDVVSDVVVAADDLTSSAVTLSETSRMLSDAAQNQAASIEESSASLEEMSGSIDLINENAKTQDSLSSKAYNSMEELKKDVETVMSYTVEALNMSKDMTAHANSGRDLMTDTITGMNSIDESTKRIAEMVLAISDISDKVNLLALNASIEAARAGEYGRGFAVVAEEISKLADQTASSAKNITEIVNSGLSQVGKGKEYVEATAKGLDTIVELIQKMEGLVQKITESAEVQSGTSVQVLADIKSVMEMADHVSKSTNEQMLSNVEIAKTMDQINMKTQETAAAAEEIAASAGEINSRSAGLKEKLSFFKI